MQLTIIIHSLKVKLNNSSKNGLKPLFLHPFIFRFLTDFKDMSGKEIMQDRYAKYRSVGLFNEFLVNAGEWEAAKERRA